MTRQGTGERRSGRLLLVRVPLDTPFPQDFPNDGILDVGLTKELRLAVHCPDPCHFGIRPLGLPSSVHVFAVTFEQSPVQMAVTSGEVGHVFNEPQAPTFRIGLVNVTNAQRTETVIVEARDLGGKAVSKKLSWLLPALEQTRGRFPSAPCCAGITT